MPEDLSNHFETKLKAAIDVDYFTVQKALFELLNHRKKIAQTALTSDYKPHKDQFGVCNKQLKRLLAL